MIPDPHSPDSIVPAESRLTMAGIHTIRVSDWSDTEPIATGASGDRDATRLAFRLTLTPHAGGVYPEKSHHYIVKFRDDGSNVDVEWNVQCTYIPDSKIEPFNFEEIKPRSGQ
jgi:hypothetical protein